MRMIDQHPSTHPDSYMIVDNCSAHVLDSATLDSFSKIKIVYLPKNSTSVFQPCDQKLFFGIKRKYRNLLAAQKAQSIPNDYHNMLLNINSPNEINDLKPKLVKNWKIYRYQQA